MACSRFQFGLRHQLIVVAFFGIVFGYERAGVRWAEYRRRANLHAHLREEYVVASRYPAYLVQFDSVSGGFDPEPPPLRFDSPRVARPGEVFVMSDYHARMSRYWIGQW